MSTSIPIAEAQKSLSDIANRAAQRGERIALSKDGKDLAVIVSVEDAERLDQLDDARDLAEAERRLSDPTQVPIPFVPKG